jgi:predicted Zn finger-like uncharacterized protein
MAIQASCPHCRAKFQVKDSLQGKTIRCEECQEDFVVGKGAVGKGQDLQQKVRAGNTPTRKTRLASADEEPPQRKRRKEEDEGVRSRRPREERPRDEEDEDRPRRRRREDPDDDDRPRRRKKEAKKSSMGLIIGLCVGGLLLVGGVVLTVVLVMNSDDGKKDNQQAGINFQFNGKDVKIDINGIPELKNFPIQPPKGFNPVQPKARGGDEVVNRMEDLKSPFTNGEAMRWLAKNANPNHPRRGEVASAIIESIKKHPFSHDDTVQALKGWGNKDLIPTLVEMVEKRTRGNLQAIEVLGHLKDPTTFETIAKRLPDFNDRGSAIKALKEIGPMAEVVVVPYLFHQDYGLQLDTRKLLDEYGTKDEVILGQVAKELREGQKVAATTYLIKIKAKANEGKVNESKRDEVAKALEPLLKDPDNRVRDTARQAFAAWAGKEQIPVLIEIIGDNIRDHAEFMNTLAKYKEDRVAEALAQRLTILSDRGNASRALKEIGGSVAEKYVLKYLHHPDVSTRFEANKLLKDFGTPDSALLARTLEDLKSADSGYRRQAVEWLNQRAPDPARKVEVAQALQPLANDPDGLIRSAASRALKTWGDGAAVPNVPVANPPVGNPPVGNPPVGNPPVGVPPVGGDLLALVKTIETPGDNNARHQAMDQLAKLKNQGAAEVLAKCLANPTDRQRASQSLKSMGPVAEGPTCFMLLNSPDTQVRIEACNILAMIGTRGSLPVLFQIGQATQKDAKNKGLYNAAGAAAKAISSR